MQNADGFDRFWNAHPRKQKKGDAKKAWAQIRPSDSLVERMIDTLAWQVRQPQWLKDDGQFIPLPATWLRSEQWDDEPPVNLREQQRREGAIELQRFKDEAAARWRA
jgi:hypothetical protein